MNIEKICPDGHRCLNGATCIKDPEENTSSYVCDCSTYNGDTSDLYAGRYCEFGASMICYEDSQIMDVPANYQLSFCTNGGVCNEKLDVDSIGREHAGCTCKDGYEGERCEYPKGTGPNKSKSTDIPGNDPGDSLAVIWILILSVVSLVAFCVLGKRELKRRKNREEVEKMDDLKMRSNTDAVLRGEASMPNVEELKNFGNVSVVVSSKRSSFDAPYSTTSTSTNGGFEERSEAPLPSMPLTPPPPPPPPALDVEAQGGIPNNENTGSLMVSTSEENDIANDNEII